MPSFRRTLDLRAKTQADWRNKPTGILWNYEVLHLGRKSPWQWHKLVPDKLGNNAGGLDGQQAQHEPAVLEIRKAFFTTTTAKQQCSQRGCALSIVREFQDLTGQSPEQPGPTPSLTLVWAWGWTRNLLRSLLNCIILLAVCLTSQNIHAKFDGSTIACGDREILFYVVLFCWVFFSRWQLMMARKYRSRMKVIL